jgi:hypothetical protein
MKVYLTGRNQCRQHDFLMCVAPAATAQNQECPNHWFDENGKPAQFKILFEYGEAEVEDGIAKVLLEQGVVRKTKLILPRDFTGDDDGANSEFILPITGG